MIILIKRSISYLTEHPRKLFLVDSMGALLTTAQLFFVLRPFHLYFGMDEGMLTQLSVFTTCFFIYSMVCFLFLKRRWAPFIKAIAIANLFYCILTMCILVMYFKELTLIGVTYIFIEAMVICTLVYVEFKTAVNLKKS